MHKRNNKNIKETMKKAMTSRPKHWGETKASSSIGEEGSLSPSQTPSGFNDAVSCRSGGCNWGSSDSLTGGEGREVDGTSFETCVIIRKDSSRIEREFTYPLIEKENWHLKKMKPWIVWFWKEVVKKEDVWKKSRFWFRPWWWWWWWRVLFCSARWERERKK